MNVLAVLSVFMIISSVFCSDKMNAASMDGVDVFNGSESKCVASEAKYDAETEFDPFSSENAELIVRVFVNEDGIIEREYYYSRYTEETRPTPEQFEHITPLINQDAEIPTEIIPIQETNSIIAPLQVYADSSSVLFRCAETLYFINPEDQILNARPIFQEWPDAFKRSKLSRDTNYLYYSFATSNSIRRVNVITGEKIDTGFVIDYKYPFCFDNRDGIYEAHDSESGVVILKHFNFESSISKEFKIHSQSPNPNSLAPVMLSNDGSKLYYKCRSTYHLSFPYIYVLDLCQPEIIAKPAFIYEFPDLFVLSPNDKYAIIIGTLANPNITVIDLSKETPEHVNLPFDTYSTPILDAKFSIDGKKLYMVSKDFDEENNFRARLIEVDFESLAPMIDNKDLYSEELASQAFSSPRLITLML